MNNDTMEKWREYTEEEKKQTGNFMYGGKRHDELCDKFQSDYKLDESQINLVSMGIWAGIESESKKRHEEQCLKNEKALEALERIAQYSCEDSFHYDEIETIKAALKGSEE